jgi:hypothetical protein
MNQLIEGKPGRYWHILDDGRIQCDLCPRYCKLHEGQRGLCFVRARQDGQMVLTTYGRSSGFCIDPIEKVFRRACKLGCEGIVSKRRDAPYRSGRVRTWIKVKNPASPAMARMWKL